MEFSEYVNAHKSAIDDIEESVLDKFLEVLSDLRKSDRTLWIAGNGGSSATASHAVADLTKTITQAGQKGIKCVALSEMISLQTAFANDNSFEDAMHDTLEIVGRQGDALLIFSVSGRSPNLLQAAKAARSSNMNVLSVVGQRGQPIVELSHLSILLSSDDYQVVENIHLALVHWFVKKLM